MNQPEPDAVVHPVGERPVVPRRNVRRAVVAVSAGVILFGVAVGVFLPVVNRFRAREAQAGMLATPAPIDGPRAYKYLKQICDFGPHPAGSDANTRLRRFMAKHFEKAGAKLVEQPFTGNDPRSGEKVAMVNLVASWNPDRRDRVVIGAHYDSRPFPDQDPDPAKRTIPFLGANDPGSGMALLMEIANHLDKLPTPWGVDLVLFDGEELVYGKDGEYFLGSKVFARTYADGVDSRDVKSRYAAGIVLDMVGDRNLKLDQEEYSVSLAPGLVREVWGVARQLKASAFRQRVGSAVLDDHLPLNNAGIPTIDIINFGYPYWHTSADTPDKLSAASLEQVGRVVTAWLAQPRRRTR